MHGLNRADVLRCDQNVNLLEEPFELFLEFLEELIGFSVTGSNDFYLNNIVDKIHAAVFPRILIRSRLRTHGECSKNSDQVFTNLLDLLSFDLLAIVIFSTADKSHSFFMQREKIWEAARFWRVVF